MVEQRSQETSAADRSELPSIRGVWRVALTLANNICVQESDRLNSDDAEPAAINATSECARRIRDWLEPSDEQIAEMLREGGVL